MLELECKYLVWDAKSVLKHHDVIDVLPYRVTFYNWHNGKGYVRNKKNNTMEIKELISKKDGIIESDEREYLGTEYISFAGHLDVVRLILKGTSYGEKVTMDFYKVQDKSVIELEIEHHDRNILLELQKVYGQYSNIELSLLSKFERFTGKTI